MRPKASHIALTGLALLCLTLPEHSRAGKIGVYGFLDLICSPYVAAFGGRVNAIASNDVAVGWSNPALLNHEMHRSVSLNYVAYLSDIRFGYAAYGHNVKNNGHLSLGVQYVNYGRFTGADESGTITGTFGASDYALVVGYAREMSFWGQTFMMGVQIKPVYSKLEKYRSFGLAADIGWLWKCPSGRDSWALVIRHIGTQITAYTDNRESLPTLVELGYSRRFENTPFRISVVAHHLETPKLGKKESFFNEQTGMWENRHESTWKTIGKETLRHLIIGGEFLPFDGFALRAGYHFNRREELKHIREEKTIGFSWGFGIRVSHFEIDFARSAFHLAGSANFISLRTFFDSYRKYTP